MRQRRTHLGDGISEAKIHDRDDDRGDEHATPAAHVETEVPAREVSGDNRADSKRPKGEDAGVAPQLAFFEIVLFGDMIGDPVFMLLHSHFPTPSVKFAVPNGKIHTMARLDSNRPGVAAKRMQASRSAHFRSPDRSPISSLRISIMTAGRAFGPACLSTV